MRLAPEVPSLAPARRKCASMGSQKYSKAGNVSAASLVRKSVQVKASEANCSCKMRMPGLSKVEMSAFIGGREGRFSRSAGPGPTDCARFQPPDAP
jgi:hypothetical protein